MKNTYKNAFDKIGMSEEAKADIREKIGNAGVAEQKRRSPVILKVAAVAALFALVVAVVPPLRSAAVSAFKYIAGVFTFADDSEVTIVLDDEERSVTFDTPDNETEYVEESGGKVYFVLDGTKKDITDELGSSEYLRFEKPLKNGKSVILIGGKPGSYGWVELLFDNDGNYITNRMRVPEVGGETLGWEKIAMHNEGVYSGDPEPDDLLTSEAD